MVAINKVKKERKASTAPAAEKRDSQAWQVRGRLGLRLQVLHSGLSYGTIT